PSAVVSSERETITAGPSSTGCASIAGGSTHSTPWAASGTVRKNGETTAIGWTAEQTSCRQPGRVSASDRQPPPTVSAASTTLTDRPAFASTIAAARPFGPAPITMASRARDMSLRRSYAGGLPGGSRFWFGPSCAPAGRVASRVTYTVLLNEQSG